jgi:hypothetical protein
VIRVSVRPVCPGRAPGVFLPKQKTEEIKGQTKITAHSHSRSLQQAWTSGVEMKTLPVKFCEHLNEAGVVCARCECLVLGVTVCVLVCCEWVSPSSLILAVSQLSACMCL